MALAFKIIAGLILAYLVIGDAALIHFPYGKTVVYKYSANVKVAMVEPASYASAYEFTGLLYMRHDLSDSSHPDSYYVALTDIEHGLFNGQMNYNEKIKQVQYSIPDAARVLQDPFMIIYDYRGKLRGVRIPESEMDWSRNLKHAIANNLQLDFFMMDLRSNSKMHSFIAEERTIHGTCQVDYLVTPEKEEQNIFHIIKSYEPRQCSGFIQDEFDLLENTGGGDVEEDMVTFTRKQYEVEKIGDDVLIKKFVGHSNINYLPWMHRSEAHYLLTNQTLTLEKVMSTADIKLPDMNFEHIPMTEDVSYKRPSSNYAFQAAPDVTHGRHIVKLDHLMFDLKKVLEEAADYLDEVHLSTTDLEWKHGQTINHLMQLMLHMDPGSLEQVYNVIKDTKTQKEISVKNIFFQMIPTIGTTSTSLFIRNLIRKNILPTSVTIDLLNTLPSFIKKPSVILLGEMEDFIKFDDSFPLEVRKAGILCFSSLIYKTYRPTFSKIGVGVYEKPAILDKYLQEFLDKVKNEPQYEMKIVYLAALNNIRVGQVQRLLMPIIEGEVSFPKRQNQIRVTALWSIFNIVPQDSQYIKEHLWPILANVKEPLKIRLTVCFILMTNVQNTNDMLKIYWFMVSEKNLDIHNYYRTFMKTLADSVSPWKKEIGEMARKMLRFIKPRNSKSSLSVAYNMEYYDSKYGHGDTVESNLFMNERSGLPEMGNVMHIGSVGRKMLPLNGIHWNIEGLKFLISSTNDTPSFEKNNADQYIVDEKVINLLRKGAEDLHLNEKDVFADIFLFMHGRVIMVKHYDHANGTNIRKDFQEMITMMGKTPQNWQHLMYHNLYQMHAPTDLGVAAVMGTYIPNLTSFRLKMKEGSNQHFKLEIEPKIWRHGEYQMKVYNPIADVWHSVEKITTVDVALPLGFLLKTHIDFGKNLYHKLGLTLSRLPDPKFSIIGVRMYAMNMVSIWDNESNLLEKLCPTCKHHEVVTKGLKQRKYYKNVVDSKNTGLRYTVSIFDCENGVTPASCNKEFYRSLSTADKSHGVGWFAHVFLALTQHITNNINSPWVGTCGRSLRIEPSTTFPISEVVINLQFQLLEGNNLGSAPIYLMNLFHTEAQIQIDVKRSNPSDLIRSWNFTISCDLNYENHLEKIAVLLRRSSPGEKDLNVKLEVEKFYPEVSDDFLKVRIGHEEVNTKFIFQMSQDLLPETFLKVNVKAEASEEQKKKFWQMRDSSALVNAGDRSCSQDEKNPLFANPKHLVPWTWNCIREAMVFTEMRQYTVEAEWGNIQPDLEFELSTIMDYVWSFLPPRIRHQWCPEENYVKSLILFPMDSDTIDIHLMKSDNCSAFSLLEIPIDSGVSYLIRDQSHVWLALFHSDMIHVCTIYPKVLLLRDNVTLPIDIPQEWTLLTGDGFQQTYAIFVKSMPDKTLDMMIIVENHKLELQTRNENTVIKFDGSVLEDLTNIPSSFISSATRTNDGAVVLHVKRVGFLWLRYAMSSVSIVGTKPNRELDVGLCGYVENETEKNVPKLYTLQV